MLDTVQPQSRMLIALLSEFARAESESMGVRIQSVMEAKRAKGEWLTGKPPFGYEITADKHLRPVEPGASAMPDTAPREAVKLPHHQRPDLSGRHRAESGEEPVALVLGTFAVARHAAVDVDLPHG